MRYYSFDEFDGEEGWVTTLSEEDIRRDYFPYWQKRMIEKFGEEYYNANYSFEDCLQDFIKDFDKTNDYLRSWSEEQKFNMINEIDYDA